MVGQVVIWSLTSDNKPNTTQVMMVTSSVKVWGHLPWLGV